MNSTISNITTENPITTSLLTSIKKYYQLIGLEALLWIVGLLFIIFIHHPGKAHFTICPLANLGIEFCPGCGLGNSISYLFMGDFVLSFQSHPLGVFALIIVTLRIISIIKNNWRRYA